ncbi:sensor histidine kinase [Sinomonas albida]|uniref:sensor histidine kinase n=1 Tax=Sinomonas albida TaxID=369942 RepID=UPI00228602AC|nr:ATP-binding protein [Sinomonas albida]
MSPCTDSLAAARRTTTILHRRLAESEEKTRARLSRDLHDGALQSLFHLVKIAEGPYPPTVGHASVEDRLLAALARITDLAKDIAFELRQVAEDLRPPMLDQLSLPLALDALANRYRSTFGMDVTLVVTGDAEPPQGHLATVLYRVAGEAISNVLRHAQAEHAELQLDLRPDLISLAVVDDGRGFAVTADELLVLTAEGHLGLAGIFERTREIGGTASIERRASRGTELRVSIPRASGHRAVASGLAGKAAVA